MKHWSEEFITDVGTTTLDEDINVYPPNPAIFGMKCHEDYCEYFEMELVPNSEIKISNETTHSKVLFRSRVREEDAWIERELLGDISLFSLSHLPLTNELPTGDTLIH